MACEQCDDKTRRGVNRRPGSAIRRGSGCLRDFTDRRGGAVADHEPDNAPDNAPDLFAVAGARPGTACPVCGSAGGPAGGKAGGPVTRRPRGGALLLAGTVAVAVLVSTLSACGPYGGASEASDASDGRSGERGAADDIGDLGGAPRRIDPADPPGAPAASPDRATPKPPAKAEPPGDARSPSYSAWAGPGCTGGGLYRENGRFADGDAGWYTVGSGGHLGDGCDGSFTAVPMSGSRTEDGGSTVVWSWYVGSGYPTCSVAVVVPDSGRDRDVAGEPTSYNVLSDPDDPDSVVKVFEVDQTRLRGSGVVVEKVPVHDQRLTVQLVDRGRGQGDAHHAAAQMRAECRT
ncbi:adhesin [Streptomyces sp. NPDC048389]|uniref:adhesin n=1 Tax=Streptomyces sp. NPDC048389 TaxID=3154622 RepID=UPI003454D5E4